MTFSIFGLAAMAGPHHFSDESRLTCPAVVWGARPSQPSSETAWRFSNSTAAPALETALLNELGETSADHQWFAIFDHRDAIGAEWLLDNRDFGDEADAGLPHRAAERIELLVDLVTAVIDDPNVTSLAIALTDCFEIERVVQTTRSTFAAAMRADFFQESPSNAVYAIA
jgi:hypothetical protein